MDDLMKEIYRMLGVSPKADDDNCIHGNDRLRCMTCEKQELRRQEAREEMARYQREKDGE